MKKTMVLITAHPEKESLCHSNADVIEKAAKKRGYKVLRFEAFDYPLPTGHPFKGGFGKEYDDPAEAFTQADTFVVVTPMWNFSLPGGLKNFLDGAVQARKSFRFKSVLGRFGVPVGLLKAKKVVSVWTADGPRFGYMLVARWNGVHNQIKSIFRMCGVKKYDQLLLDETHWKCRNDMCHKSEFDKWFKKLENYKW